MLPLPGLYARLYEGRCYLALGNYQSALGSFEDIRSQPNVLPPLRKLIAAAIRFRAECLLAQEKVDAAIEDCRACLADAKSDEEKQPEWLAVRFQLAQALRKKAESLPAEARTNAASWWPKPRDAYRLVANSPGEFQSAARTASVALGRRSKVAKQGRGKEDNEPRDFPTGATITARTRSPRTTPPSSPSPPPSGTIPTQFPSSRTRWKKGSKRRGGTSAWP